MYFKELETNKEAHATHIRNLKIASAERLKVVAEKLRLKRKNKQKE